MWLNKFKRSVNGIFKCKVLCLYGEVVCVSPTDSGVINIITVFVYLVYPCFLAPALSGELPTHS